MIFQITRVVFFLSLMLFVVIVGVFAILYWPLALLPVVLLVSIAARGYRGVNLYPQQIYDRARRLMLMPVIGYIPGLIFIGLFLAGLSNLDHCHSNPSCDPDVLAIPLLMGIFCLGSGLVISECIIWAIHIFDGGEPLG